jgi:hypothetical protein
MLIDCCYLEAYKLKHESESGTGFNKQITIPNFISFCISWMVASSKNLKNFPNYYRSFGEVNDMITSTELVP